MELIKPVKLYKIWHAKTFGRKVALVSLRLIPIVIICAILPLGEYGFSLPISIKAGILFLISLILSASVSYTHLTLPTILLV